MRLRTRTFVFAILGVVASSVACTSILGDFEVLPSTPAGNDGGPPPPDSAPPEDSGADVDAGPDAAPPEGFTATWVSAGQNHTCAVRQGDVYCWGNNDHGQLGLLPTATPGGKSNTPVKVPNFGAGFGQGKAIVKVYAGGTHTCAIDLDGSIFCWGANDSLQLGSGTQDANPHPVPAKVPVPNGTGVVMAGLGDKNSCAVSSNGDVICWGANDVGQNGGPVTSTVMTPTRVSGVSSASMVSAGAGHACAVSASSGQLTCWGRNTVGEVGPTGIGSVVAPTVVSMTTTPFKAAAHSDVHTCVTAGSPSTVYCFGDNTQGQLGIDGGSTPTPTQIFLPPNAPALDLVQIGARTSCARSVPPASGLGCWGANTHGQLGLGTKDNDRHDHITAIPNLGLIKEHDGAFSVGLDHVCAIGKTPKVEEPGPVFCWGGGNFGKLGIDVSLMDDSPAPKPVLPP